MCKFADTSCDPFTSKYSSIFLSCSHLRYKIISFLPKIAFNSLNKSVPKILSRYANFTQMESLFILLFYCGRGCGWPKEEVGTNFEFFLVSFPPPIIFVAKRIYGWIKENMLAQASTYFLSFFHPPFVYCYSCHLCYQRGSSQAKEVGWCKIQYIWTFLFSLFLAICLLLLHLHCHKCYG